MERGGSLARQFKVNTVAGSSRPQAIAPVDATHPPTAKGKVEATSLGASRHYPARSISRSKRQCRHVGHRYRRCRWTWVRIAERYLGRGGQRSLGKGNLYPLVVRKSSAVYIGQGKVRRVPRGPITTNPPKNHELETEFALIRIRAVVATFIRKP
jgi:hypothetical protein